MNKFGNIESLRAAALNNLIDFLSVDSSGFVCGHAFPKPVALAQFDTKEEAVKAVTEAGWKQKFLNSDLRYVRIGEA